MDPLRRMKPMKFVRCAVSFFPPVICLAMALSATRLWAADAAAPAPPSPAAAAAAAIEPGSSSKIIEDDRVRIEEVRVRGQLKRIVVRSKLTGQSYEIVVGSPGRDPSAQRDAAGQRGWSILTF